MNYSYRKRDGSSVWHWCPACSNWPESDYDARDSKPTSGSYCTECQGKDNKGECQE